MAKKIYCLALIIFFALTFALPSCSPPVTVDQSINPHDVAMKAISELGYTEKDLSEISGTDDEGLKIVEYYSEGSGDYILDDIRFNIMVGFSGDSIKLDMIEQYSIMLFNKDLPVPFELMIFKLPQTDGKNDSELINKLKKQCTDHIAQYKTSMQDYLPKFVPYLENAVITVTDNFVYYCVAENSSKVTAVITNYLSGK